MIRPARYKHPMSSKSERRRRRQEQRRRQREHERERAREAADELASPDHVAACADVALTELGERLGDLFEDAGDLAHAAIRARDAWPVDDVTHELRALLEELRNAALAVRDRLAASHDRLSRVRARELHLHLIGGRVVQMAPVDRGDARHADGGVHPDDDIPF